MFNALLLKRGLPTIAGVVATESPNQPQAPARAEIRLEPGGRGFVTLRGRLDAPATAVCWNQLEHGLRGVSALDIDASEISYCDGSGIALLWFLQTGGMTPGAAVTVHGLKAEFEKLFANFTLEDYEANRRRPAEKTRVPEEVGKGVQAMLRDLREQVAFIGLVVVAFTVTLFRPRRMRWREVIRIFEIAGVNALPIISLISLLVGLIIAFESAQPLKTFGAQIFIANMIGLVMIRELGPLMTAIMLAGRSGSAFAAELGTMKVNEELSALQTMGLDPVRFLVVQRIMAGVLLTPLLTLYSMLMGVLGGVIVMAGLGFPLVVIYSQLVSSVRVGDILLGTTKGFVFGIIVAGIGCLRGLQTQKGPSAVGESTTRAVVSSILLIVIADAVFSALAFVLK